MLARQLLERGARVAICSRNEMSLNRALNELRQINDQVLAFRCDVRNNTDVENFVSNVSEVWGQPEVVINVAGIIEVGPVDAMEKNDFEDSMATNCWGALNVIRAVLPAMREAKWGRIVNIASLGGKRAVPHMSPYSASKFALVGLSSCLRAELQKDGVLVTTICPGLMRTGSPRNATFKGKNHAEFTWFSIGDSLPGLSMSAEKAASEILSVCQRGDAEVILGAVGKLGVVLQSVMPNLMAEAFALGNRLLPAMGGIGNSSALGFESQTILSPSALTTLSDRAAERNNELM